MIVRRTKISRVWLDALRDRKTQLIIARRLSRLASANFGDSRSVGSGVFELRIDYGPGYRVYYIQRGKELVILLCGGDKNTQTADITRAKKLAEEAEEED